MDDSETIQILETLRSTEFNLIYQNFYMLIIPFFISWLVGLQHMFEILH